MSDFLLTPDEMFSEDIIKNAKNNILPLTKFNNNIVDPDTQHIINTFLPTIISDFQFKISDNINYLLPSDLEIEILNINNNKQIDPNTESNKDISYYICKNYSNNTNLLFITKDCSFILSLNTEQDSKFQILHYIDNNNYNKPLQSLFSEDDNSINSGDSVSIFEVEISDNNTKNVSIILIDILYFCGRSFLNEPFTTRIQVINHNVMLPYTNAISYNNNSSYSNNNETFFYLFPYQYLPLSPASINNLTKSLTKPYQLLFIKSTSTYNKHNNLQKPDFFYLGNDNDNDKLVHINGYYLWKQDNRDALGLPNSIFVLMKSLPIIDHNNYIIEFYCKARNDFIPNFTDDLDDFDIMDTFRDIYVDLLVQRAVINQKSYDFVTDHINKLSKERKLKNNEFIIEVFFDKNVGSWLVRSIDNSDKSINSYNTTINDFMQHIKIQSSRIRYDELLAFTSLKFKQQYNKIR